MKKYFLAGCVAVVLTLLTGCLTPIGVDQVTARQAYQHLNQNALNSSHCSADTMRVLNRYDLEKAFDKNPDATLAKLQTIACTDDRRDLLYALSELNFQNADRQGRSVKPGVPKRARDSYFASAIYAYLYLFGGSHDAPPSPFDMRVRVAGDLYNCGLAQGLIINTNAQVQMASGPRFTPPGKVEVAFTHPEFPIAFDQISAFYSADDFLVRGLSTRNRDSGLGAPLIADCNNVGQFREQRRMAATVFLRVSGNIRDWTAGKLKATLEVYSPFAVTHVEVNGHDVPLQTDTTVPLAQGLNNSPIWSLGVSQFFSTQGKVKTGIRPMQPYVPGRIPVVFVHGTASSPVWWAEMWNTLRADPVIRDHYQFWMFNYASGNPITYTAGILRNDLMNQIKLFDPEGKDAALQQTVIVGHSQGGLLAKLTATDTGDKLWQLFSKTNLDELKVDPEMRDLLRSNFFFKQLPCVSRVIFIATPHRGSYRNSSFVQKFLYRFMEFPKDLVNASMNLLKLRDTIQLPASVRNGVPSSLHGMSTNNPFMLTLADIPVAPGIKCNSIIAIKGDDQPPKGADGVVQYTSAHVDYAESEFIVRSGHSCQMNPLTIEEVRRILLKQLAETKSNK
jgi:pimeloyl-ACP methyl ester carboxylesterase